MKNKIIVISIIFLVFTFFSYNVIYTFDSFHYLNYVDILFNRIPFNSWDIVRGPAFPSTIFIISVIFGESQNAHLLLQFTNYLVFISIIYFIFNQIIDEFKYKKIVNALLILIIAFNPVIFGYFHVMLTEFIAITMTMVAIYLSYKWINISDKKNKIIYTITFSILLTYLWFLKQPYAVCVIAPLLVSSILSFIKNKRKENVLYRIGTIIISLLVMALSISVWNAILIKNNVNMNTGRNSGNMLATTMLELKPYEIIDSKCQDFSKYDLSEKEIKKVRNQEYIILLTYDKNKIIDKDYLELKNNSIKLSQAILTSVQNIFQHPSILLPQYAGNYCAVSSVCKIESDDGVIYRVIDGIDYKHLFENDIIGYRIFKNDIEYNSFQVPDTFAVNKEKYTVHKNAGVINYFFRALMPLTTIMYKILILFCPIILMALIVLSILLRKNYKELSAKCELPIICASFSLLYLMADSYIGAIIDRYSVEAFAPLLISFISIIYILIKLLKLKNNKKIAKIKTIKEK